ncbi:MAG TPA: enoyl-CoA hydratase-related protein, partial [Thermoanaerobaculia bacterium]|nr:enoyl-CoA hydratase-related protein [Thermoanaerobaculia bacterium]
PLMNKLRVELTDDRARIILADPPLHILDVAMLESLRDALGDLPAAIPLVIIESEGEKAFSAGASVPDHLGERLGPMLDAFHEALRRLRRLDAITVAKVRGLCLGGGCELALACDFVIASDRAKFGQPEIHLGVFPPVAAWQLARSTHPRKGLELFLTGDAIGAEEAERLGLVNAVLAFEGFDALVEEWLARITRHSRSSLLLAKKAFRLAEADDFEARLSEIERLYRDELVPTADATEGLVAFIEKRKPVWKGR